MSKDKEKKAVKNKQPFRTVLSNNLFLIKLCFMASPAFIIFPVLDAIRTQVSIFFEHTVGIGYVLEAAEFGYPFERVGLVIIILFICISVGMLFSVWVGDYVRAKEFPKVSRKVKLMLYDKAARLDLECYDNPEYYNEMVLAVSEVDKQIERCLQFLTNMFSGLTIFITSGIYFMEKDEFSILFALASFLFSFFFMKAYNKLSFKIRVSKNPAERRREYVKRVFYLPDCAKEMRLNPGAADILYKEFDAANEEVINIEKKYARKHFLFGFMANYVGNDFFCDVLYITYLILRATVWGSLAFSSVAILYHSFGRMKRGMGVFTETYPFACETSLYVQKIRKFLEYETKIVSTEGRIPQQGAVDVNVRDLAFAYGKAQEMLLKDININIKPGEKIALVGYNGAGKTTFVKLLMRLYDPVSGQIRMNGSDIKAYDVEKFRHSIGVVFQDFKIFAGTIAENVAMDNLRGDEVERIRAALSDGGLLSRVDRMEKGLDTFLTTEIDDDGVNLSGGEAQKLAISRVFYQNAGLMILDEPSSALDPIAEYQLNHAMLTATTDKTVIFISHRLSTTRIADRIIMLENGRVVEEGTHEELLKLGGKYAQMWNVQAGAYM
ncbi:MAG: ABC transporter ATP-binding protein/permease [Lachnospiraceae bacterium]|nr:ABC transporter ATP-binding protein/permease [Lachnospiraceae bacterium]